MNVLAGESPLAQAIALLQRGRIDVFIEAPKVFRESVATASSEGGAKVDSVARTLERAQAAAREVAQAVQGREDAGGAVVRITRKIDGIGFQTNLLPSTRPAKPARVSRWWRGRSGR